MAAAVAEANANSVPSRAIPTDFTVELMSDHDNQYVSANKAAPWYDPVQNKIYTAANPTAHCSNDGLYSNYESSYPNIMQGQKLCWCHVPYPPPSPPPPSPPIGFVGTPGFYWSRESKDCIDTCVYQGLFCQDTYNQNTDNPMGQLHITWAAGSWPSTDLSTIQNPGVIGQLMTAVQQANTNSPTHAITTDYTVISTWQTGRGQWPMYFQSDYGSYLNHHIYVPATDPWPDGTTQSECSDNAFSMAQRLCYCHESDPPSPPLPSPPAPVPPHAPYDHTAMTAGWHWAHRAYSQEQGNTLYAGIYASCSTQGNGNQGICEYMGLTADVGVYGDPTSPPNMLKPDNPDRLVLLKAAIAEANANNPALGPALDGNGDVMLEDPTVDSPVTNNYNFNPAIEYGTFPAVAQIYLPLQSKNMASVLDDWGNPDFRRLCYCTDLATNRMYFVPRSSVETVVIMQGTVETFDTQTFEADLTTALGGDLSNGGDLDNLTVTVEPASVRVTIRYITRRELGNATAELYAALDHTGPLGARLERFVTYPTGVAFAYPPSPPPRPPGAPHPMEAGIPDPSPPPAPSPPPPSPPPLECTLSDNQCSPFKAADWSSAFSSYHFYLYDETPDGIDLRLWEWPRVTPVDDQLANNGICEDGHPSTNASVPEGNYYVAFGGANCATHHVNLSTGLIAGCGRVDLVPCMHGTDCTDCGRSESMEVWFAAGGDPFKAYAAKLARHRVNQIAYDRRKMQALPELHDAHELHHLNRTLALTSSYHLPKPWLEALQIKDHWDP
jgi:hypothetical protein